MVNLHAKAKRSKKGSAVLDWFNSFYRLNVIGKMHIRKKLFILLHLYLVYVWPSELAVRTRCKANTLDPFCQCGFPQYRAYELLQKKKVALVRKFLLSFTIMVTDKHIGMTFSLKAGTWVVWIYHIYIFNHNVPLNLTLRTFILWANLSSAKKTRTRDTYRRLLDELDISRQLYFCTVIYPIG